MCRLGNKAGSIVLVLLAAGLWAPRALAGVPDWLRQAASESLPKYSDQTKAVVLLDEQATTVRGNGEVTTVYRRAYRILRPEGRGLGTVPVFFDSETRVTSLKAWAIPAHGKEYEVNDKDAFEGAAYPDFVLYADDRAKVLRIPGVEVGSVIGYEFEQRRRPYILQDSFTFQNEIPVHRARFTLTLPAGWEYQENWTNHAAVIPSGGGASWTWELTDLPAVEYEHSMPAWRALAGRMVVNYLPSDPTLRGKSLTSWREIGLWYQKLTANRRDPSPQIQHKVAALVAGAPTAVEKMRRLAAFLQREVRYVAISLGIGGYQPHAAYEVFENRYGDCKDKATLLSAMLQQAGIQSYYVIVQTSRGVVNPDSPSPFTFNHVILAIQLPPEVPDGAFASVVRHPRLGRLLFFDPTDELTPLGSLPYFEQGNRVLLVTDEGGELVQLPLLAPDFNRLQRTAKLSLNPDGTLSGEVRETASGSEARNLRALFRQAPVADRRKYMESFLANFLSGFVMLQAEFENLDNSDLDLGLRYSFSAQNYAQRAGELLLVRPRVLGQKSSGVLEMKDRKHPVEFDAASLESDTYEIALPEGYEVDELPPPTVLDAGFAEYHSKVEMAGTVLRYQRELRIKDVFIPTERLPELKKFYRQVAADENRSAVLKRAAR